MQSEESIEQYIQALEVIHDYEKQLRELKSTGTVDNELEQVIQQQKDFYDVHVSQIIKHNRQLLESKEKIRDEIMHVAKQIRNQRTIKQQNHLKYAQKLAQLQEIQLLKDQTEVYNESLQNQNQELQDYQQQNKEILEKLKQQTSEIARLDNIIQNTQNTLQIQQFEIQQLKSNILETKKKLEDYKYIKQVSQSQQATFRVQNQQATFRAQSKNQDKEQSEIITQDNSENASINKNYPEDYVENGTDLSLISFDQEIQSLDQDLIETNIKQYKTSF